MIKPQEYSMYFKVLSGRAAAKDPLYSDEGIFVVCA
jgi:hypothetical protein